MAEQEGTGGATEAKSRAERARIEEVERQVRGRVHRHMGWLSTVLVLVAVWVALARIEDMFPGYSAWDALGIGATGLPWVLGILGLGVFFSMGTTRIMLGLEWIAKRLTTRRAGK